MKKHPKCYQNNSRINVFQNQALPILPLIQYVLRGAAMLSGRLLNRWWRNLSNKEKTLVKLKIKRYSKVLTGVGVVLIGSETYVYYQHLEVSPHTGRKRFMIINKDDFNEILGDSLIEGALLGSNILPSNHPYYKPVKAIIDTVVTKNKNAFPSLRQNWKLVICENDEMVNAACLPTGEIIVFTGLIKFVENNHQLAVVISHELSHIILEHGRETVSRVSLITFAMLFFGFLLWTVVPGDFMAFFVNGLKNRIMKITLELPYSRMLESEADVLGLELMARACYNVNEAKKFWDLMNIFEKQTGIQIPNWLSTHPPSALRAKHLESLIPMALKISKDCGCNMNSWTSRKYLDNYFFNKYF